MCAAIHEVEYIIYHSLTDLNVWLNICTDSEILHLLLGRNCLSPPLSRTRLCTGFVVVVRNSMVTRTLVFLQNKKNQTKTGRRHTASKGQQFKVQTSSMHSW